MRKNFRRGHWYTGCMTNVQIIEQHWKIVLILLILTINLALPIVIDNGVVGQPTISCGESVISVWVNTRKPFSGKIFVKGESENEDCSAVPMNSDGVIQNTPTTEIRPDASCPPCPLCSTGAGRQDGFDTFSQLVRHKRQDVDEGIPVLSGSGLASSAHLSIKMGTCNMKRQRQISPSGVSLEFTTVISFHKFFITKVDRAYRIKCFYMEADKTVTAEIGVSMPPTTELIAQASMPVCQYTIRRGTPDGPEVKYVLVGEQVYHRWECKSDNDEMFGLLVRNCYVNDGRGQRVELLDDKGCSLDKVILNDLTYDSFMVAHVESHVFKFADRTALDFQCAIGICVTAAGGCQGVTPPSCSNRRKLRDLMSATRGSRNPANNKDRGSHQSRSGESDRRTAADWEISAPTLTVVDLDSGILTKELANLELDSTQENQGSRVFSDASKESDIDDNLSFYHALSRDLFGENNGGLISALYPADKGAGEFSSQFCLSVTGFGLLIATSTCILTVGVMLAGTLYVLRRKPY